MYTFTRKLIDILSERKVNLSREQELLLDDAFSFAKKAHEGTVRKGTALPYIVHPMETAVIVAELTSDVHVIAAALLHDVIEDCGVTKEKLALLFGSRVADLVADESENKRLHLPKSETWKIRKEETLAHIKNASRDEKLIAMGDKISNLRSTRNDYAKMGDEIWKRFNQGDKNMHAWYYWSVADLTKEDFGATPQWKELKAMCEEVFGPQKEEWHFSSSRPDKIQ